MKECKQVEKTANKNRQFFQQDEEVRVFHCASVNTKRMQVLHMSINQSEED